MHKLFPPLVLVILLLLATAVSASEFYDHNVIPFNLSLSTSTLAGYDYMVNSPNYIVHFKNNPSEGQTISLESGGNILTMQPMALNYRNDLSQLEQISMPVSASLGNINTDLTQFSYGGAYGEGVNLTYTIGPKQIKETLVIQNSTTLQVPSAYIIDGGNAHLDIDFIIDTDSKIYIDGALWDKKNDATTTNEVNITDAEDNLLYSFGKPIAYDSNGSTIDLSYTFKKNVQTLYVILETPYSWLSDSSRVYPVYIDPTFNYDNDPTSATFLQNMKVDSELDSDAESSSDVTAGVSDGSIVTRYTTLASGNSGDALTGSFSMGIYDDTSSNNYYLRMYKPTTGATSTISVWSYTSSDNEITTEYDFVGVSGVGWYNFNITALIEEENATGRDTIKLRFYSSNSGEWSEMMIRETVEDNQAPSVVNCTVSSSNIGCSGDVTYSCIVTDDIAMGNVSYTIDGINYSTTQYVSNWNYTLNFTDVDSVDEWFNFTDVFAYDSFSQLNHTTPDLSVHHYCALPDISGLLSPATTQTLLAPEYFVVTCEANNTDWANLTNVNITTRYTNGTSIPLNGGPLVANESATYNCPVSLLTGETCAHSWEIAANATGDNLNLECYVEAGSAEGGVTDSSSYIRIDALGAISDLTIELDTSAYNPGATSTAELTSEFTSIDYNVIWYNNDSTIMYCNETGTTPATANEIFFDSCEIWANASLQTGAYAQFYINGKPSINVTDTFSITDIDANAYVVSEIALFMDSCFLNSKQSIRARITDSSAEYAVAECCKMQVDNAATGTPVYNSPVIRIDGDGQCEHSFNLDHVSFFAPKSYSFTITAWQCSDEDLPSADRKRGKGVGSFNTINYFTEPYEFVDIIEDNIYAGFDTVTVNHTRTNNFGVPLEVIQDVWFSNVVTEQDYHFDNMEDIVTTVNIGTSIVTEKWAVPESLPTGQYRVEKNIYYYYQGMLREIIFIKTETFNITSVQESMTISSITIKDYFGEAITTSSVAQSLDEMPVSNWTDPHYVLTEGFGYQICGDIINNYEDDIYWHMQNLVLHNPTTGQSFEEFNTRTGEKWQRILKPGSNEICWNSNLPLTIETSSDWHFLFDIYVGNAQRPFDCSDGCLFNGETEYFYAGAIEDVIVLDKWYTKPTANAVGVPLVFIVTTKEGIMSMNDDCEYKDQTEIPWGTANYTCYDKDDLSAKKIDYSIYPIAGEQFRACFQMRNYMSDEVDIEFYDVYLDNDEGETVVYFQGEETEGYTPSITDDKVYESETPSRLTELQGNLIDSYGIMCTKWMDLPTDIQGANNWDIQGKIKISRDIYNLEHDIVWNWESDEFSIYGLVADEKKYIDGTTHTDAITYKIGDELYICANVTSRYPTQLDLDITYNYRCSETSDEDNLDRHLYGEYNELRGIGANANQMQCHKFIVPDDDYFKEKGTVNCYASTIVDIPVVSEKVTSSSSIFNISKHTSTITLTSLSEDNNLYIADNFVVNVTLENPFLYKQKDYIAKYSIGIQSDENLLYVVVGELQFHANESEKNIIVDLPIQERDEYTAIKLNYDIGNGWMPKKRDAFLTQLQGSDQDIGVLVDFYIHGASFNEHFHNFTFQRPGIVTGAAVVGEAGDMIHDDVLYFNDDGLLEWYIMFNISSREGPDGTSTTLSRETWITIEGDNDVIKRCYNNYDYTNYNNASAYNPIWMKHICDVDESILMRGKEVRFFMKGQWSPTPYVFDTATISRPVVVNSMLTSLTNYTGGDIIYLTLNITGYQDRYRDIHAVLENSQGARVHEWVTPVEDYHIKEGTQIITFPFLLPVSLDETPYSGEYSIEISLENTNIGRTGIREISNNFNISTFSAIITENITSSTVDNDNPLTIDYNLNIPTKDMMFFPGKNQPFRIKYHFISENGSGRAISQFTTIDGQYAPLEVYAMFPADSTQNFSVSIQPRLPAGNYTIIEEIEIDPEGVWEGVHKGEVGSIIVTEDLTAEPFGLVDTTAYLNEEGATVFIGGTEYNPDDDGKVAIRLLKGITQSLITGATCYATILYPNQTMFVNLTSMTEQGSGLYYYDFTVPADLGVYTYYTDCTESSKNYYGMGTFHVSSVNVTASVDVASIWNYFNRTLTQNITATVDLSAVMAALTTNELWLINISTDQRYLTEFNEEMIYLITDSLTQISNVQKEIKEGVITEEEGGEKIEEIKDNLFSNPEFYTPNELFIDIEDNACVANIRNEGDKLGIYTVTVDIDKKLEKVFNLKLKPGEKDKLILPFSELKQGEHYCSAVSQYGKWQSTAGLQFNYDPATGEIKAGESSVANQDSSPSSPDYKIWGFFLVIASLYFIVKKKKTENKENTNVTGGTKNEYTEESSPVCNVDVTNNSISRSSRGNNTGCEQAELLDSRVAYSDRDEHGNTGYQRNSK